jgi:hypothetical protein
MTVEVAGTWDMGWSAPMTEMDQWWAVMRSYEIPMLHMTPASGLQHKMLTEHASFEEIISCRPELTPVFVHEDGEIEVTEFDHPESALYLFGKANFSPFVIHGEGHQSVRIACPKMGMLWPHQALAIVMYNRGLAYKRERP